MKKLLSLLSVLTISSSVIPTTIAASPYQKENNNNNLRKKMELDSNNQKENNNKTTSSHKNKNTLWKTISIFSRTIKKTTDEIKNYFYQKENNNIKTNKLKKITNLDSNRSKRQNIRIFNIDQNLIINEDEKEQYKLSMEKIINILINENIIISIFESSECEDRAIYQFNQKTNYNYFTISVSIIIGGNNTRNINLIFRIRDLYLIGFINNNHYYHFDIETDDDLSFYPGIQTTNIHNLNYTGNYNNLIGQRNPAIYWQNIIDSFFTLSNIGTRFENQRTIIQAALGRIVLITSEALRFRSIYNLIINNIIDNDNAIYWNPEENSGQINIRNIVTNWQNESNNIIAAINGITHVNQDTITELYNNLSRTPITTIPQSIGYSNNIRIVLGTILAFSININRGKAKSIDTENKYCNKTDQKNILKNKIITTIKILDKNPKGGNLKFGDTYIGTTEGIYLIHGNGLVNKFNNLNFSIKNIILDENGSAYIINKKCEIYHLNLYGWDSKKVTNIANIKNSNLKKEKEICYNEKKQTIYEDILW